MNPLTHHWSESRREIVPIEEMETIHIVNTLRRYSRQWAEAVQHAETDDDLVELISNPITSDLHVIALVYELKRRDI